MINLFNDNLLQTEVLIQLHSRNVYVLTRSHLSRLQNLGVDKCVRCNISFQEEDVIATSTSNRYCYECAIQINLISGNTRKDLSNDKIISDVLNQIKKLTKKYSINNETSSLAISLIKTAFENTNYVTKNQLGLSCAAISLANKLLDKNENSWKNSLPVSLNALGKSMFQLEKSLSNVNITLISQNILGVKH